MSRITKAIIVIGAVGLLVPAALASFGHGAGVYGGMASYARLPGYFGGTGGEFTLYNDGPPGLLIGNSAYSSKTKGKGGWAESFQTFCIEREEYTFDPVSVWVSTAWADGSNIPQWDLTKAHFPQSHAWKGSEPTGDDLDPETAYLYTQFARGVLSGYDYNPAGSRATDAVQLQNALWFIEGEITSLDSGSKAEAWYNEAVDAGWSDIGSVRVLQMWRCASQCNARQDMLYLIPVPAAAMLGVIGLGLLNALRRRLA